MGHSRDREEETDMRSFRIVPLLRFATLGMHTVALAGTFEWVTVGDPGNACDDEPLQGCFGRVDYVYRIAKFEVTNA